MKEKTEMDLQNLAPAVYSFNKPKISTKEFAAALNLQQQSIRAAFCRAGHYLGLVPIKLPNGRMLWDALAVSRLINQGHA